MLVLVVDDSISIRNFLSNSIKKKGHNVIAVSGGEEAIEIFKQKEVDLILMDAEMRGMDGFTTTQKIRELTKNHWIPIIFLSAHSQDEYIQKALDYGADVYLRKPINFVELHGQINAMARISKMRDEMAKLNDSLKLANQQLAKHANIDGLTGIANRRNFEIRLQLEANHCQRHQCALSLLLCDIDFFKQYNDSYGHVAGDKALCKVAKTIEKSFDRSTDLVARFGGEEFVVILPDTSQVDAEHLAEQMRQKIEALNIEHCDSAIAQHLTISIGIATSVGKSNIESLIEQADQALYQAKKSGRNQFKSFLAKQTKKSPKNKS